MWKNKNIVCAWDLFHSFRPVTIQKVFLIALRFNREMCIKADITFIILSYLCHSQSIDFLYEIKMPDAKCLEVLNRNLQMILAYLWSICDQLRILFNSFFWHFIFCVCQRYDSSLEITMKALVFTRSLKTSQR